MSIMLSIYTDSQGNKLMLRKHNGDYQAVKVSADGKKMHRMRGMRRCRSIDEMQDKLDRYADREKFVYCGKMDQKELELEW